MMISNAYGSILSHTEVQVSLEESPKCPVNT